VEHRAPTMFDSAPMRAQNLLCCPKLWGNQRRWSIGHRELPAFSVHVALSFFAPQSCRETSEHGTSGTENVRFDAHVRPKPFLQAKLAGKPAKAEHRNRRACVLTSLRDQNLFCCLKLRGNQQARDVKHQKVVL
jgi:hypothetical protein